MLKPEEAVPVVRLASDHQTPLVSPLALLSTCTPRGTRRRSQVCLPCCHCALQEAPDATHKSGSLSLGCPIPSRPLLFLYLLARVLQEDRSSSLVRSRPLLKKVLTNAPSVSSHIFVAIIIYIATLWLPASSTLQYFDCPHQEIPFGRHC